MNYLPVKSPADFSENIEAALKDAQLGQSLKKAMNLLRNRRQALFQDKADFEALRNEAQGVKQRALNNLAELLEKFEEKALANGFKIHWAETGQQANNLILKIMNQHQASKLVKGKSMVSEEIHTNEFLKDHGIEALETDLGEFIIQLNHEPPSHIVVPAVQKTKKDVAEIFHKYLGVPLVNEVSELNDIARKTLREHFKEAEIGLSGVNFAVAETGSLILIENEGNGRMCTTLPKVHIAVMGLEKIIESLNDLPALLRLLPGSATGQLTPNYVNIINGPRKPGEKDGPQEVHIIILDNGRSQILAHPDLHEVLQCIRCGTCLNHCPVYTRLGGLAYGSVYPGPIGLILTPQLEGLKSKGSLTSASSLCDACQEVCPVKIPIPNLIRKLRNEYYNAKGLVKGHGAKNNLVESTIWRLWSLVYATPGLLTTLTLKAGGLFGNIVPKVGPLATWSKCRKRPKIPKSSLRELLIKEGARHE